MKSSYRDICRRKPGRSYRTAHRKKRAIVRDIQPDGYSRHQQQQLSRDRFNRDVP
ncbi:hypothetical protein [Microcoleus sp. S13C4]|uniref:hypothetical protein n=1 Tax=Microcoleus sp. S13C4 TaxID=3055410 RepID=UPI002FD24D7B